MRAGLPGPDGVRHGQRLVTGGLTALLLFIAVQEALPGASCSTFWVTGYNRSDPSMAPTTADGTPTFSPEPVVAVWLVDGRRPAIPFGSIVEVEGPEGLRAFRVADTCPGCDPGHIDVGAWSNGEAYTWTGHRTVCISGP